MDPTSFTGHCTLIDVTTPLPRQVEAGHVYTLEEVTKYELLQIRELFGAEQQQAALDLATRLTNLSGGIGARYGVKTGNLDGVRFRLINPNRDLRVREQSFLALSYRWPSNQTGGTDGGLPLPVSPELWQSILRELKDVSEGLWCDQICINQSDEVEKKNAIDRMDLIYNSARAVVIALDDISLNQAEVDAMMQYGREVETFQGQMLQVPRHGEDPPYMTVTNGLCEALCKLLTSSWFIRGWCAHEMRLGTSHIFFVRKAIPTDGHTQVLRFSGTFLHYLFVLQTHDDRGIFNHRMERNTLDEEHRFSEMTEALKRVFFRDHIRACTKISKRELALQPISYTNIIQEVSETETGGNPAILDMALRREDALKDKNSILLNVMRNGLTFKRNTTHPPRPYRGEDLYLLDQMIIALAARDPVALCTTGSPIWVNGPNTRCSWVARPIKQDQRANNLSLEPLPMDLEVQIDPSAACECIDLRLVFLHRVPDVQLTEVDKTIPQYSRAERFVKLCLDHEIALAALQPLLASVNRQTENTEGMKRLYVKTLTAVLMCWDSWVDRIPVIFGHQTDHQAIRRAFEALLSWDTVSHTTWTQRTGETMAILIWQLTTVISDWGIPWKYGGLLNAIYWQPVVASRGVGLKVIVFSPPGPHKLAIPRVLINRSYKSLRRLWVLKDLERCEDKLNTFELIGKTYIFGDNWVDELADAEMNSAICRVRGDP